MEDRAEDYEDENVIAFLDFIYMTMIKDLDQDAPYSRKEIYKKFYSDLKAWKDGEW